MSNEITPVDKILGASVKKLLFSLISIYFISFLISCSVSLGTSSANELITFKFTDSDSNPLANGNGSIFNGEVVFRKRLPITTDFSELRAVFTTSPEAMSTVDGKSFRSGDLVDFSLGRDLDLIVWAVNGSQQSYRLVYNGYLYFGENGVTIKAQSEVPNGTTLKFNGGEYTVVADKTALKMKQDAGSDMGKIVTSRVVDMASLFKNKAVKGDITSWDVSNVTDMSSMFQESRAFNQPIGSWDTSSTADMSFMFLDAEIFNQDLTSWVDSDATDPNVPNTQKMFGKSSGTGVTVGAMQASKQADWMSPVGTIP